MYDLLVLGSEGFIGRSLISFYLKKGWKIIGVDRVDNPSFPYPYIKLLNVSDLTSLFSDAKINFIINAAGSGNVSFSVAHPLADFESNCYETVRILDSIRLSGSDAKYLHISSAAVYGNPLRLPVSEEDPTTPLSPYGWHKLISENLCKEYYEFFKIKSCIIRPFSVYGPGLRKQIFWDIYLKALRNSKIELFGSGNETRDFIYIEDLVNAIDIILNSAPMSGEEYNIANGGQISIHNAANEFLRNFNNKFEIVFNGQTKEGDPLFWMADISKISELGYTPKYTIEMGLKKTYEWIEFYFQNNASNV